MLIAKVQDGQVLEVGNYAILFPNTSFPQSGPTNDFMVENGCMFVNMFLPYDPNTQKLINVSPYIQIDDPAQPLNWVYTVQVAQLTPEELAQLDEQKRQANKAQAASLLSATDWTTIPDVANPAVSNPYLLNQAEFAAYRSQVRQIAVYPPVTVDVWPTVPVEQWSK